MKQKIKYQCKACTYQPVKWLGCCPECKQWETIEEIAPSVVISKFAGAAQSSGYRLVPLSNISTNSQERFRAGIHEWDRVLGGGIMPGSLLLLAGDPGIGKSTLLLQIANRLADNASVLYFSSEESLEQVKLRAERTGCNTSKVLFTDQAQVESIIATIAQHKPDIVIIDSIQNCYSTNSNAATGSIAQLRERVFAFMRVAKDERVAILMSGHITKEGDIAGPKLLEHMVDGVFYLHGEDRWQTRILRAVKNRFGAINELGFFEMAEQGMVEVPNINQELLDAITTAPGSVLISSLEGSRPLLLELQALTIPAKFGIPQRVITGLDHKRVVLIAAILEKYLHVKLSEHDIFFKVSGSFKLKESAVDLGIALALLSSYFQQPLTEKSIALGELSLTGQIKPINQIGMHLSEANNFRINKIYVSHQQKVEQTDAPVVRLKNVYDLLTLFSARTEQE